MGYCMRPGQHMQHNQMGLGVLPFLLATSPLYQPMPNSYALHTNCHSSRAKFDRLLSLQQSCLISPAKPCAALRRGWCCVFGFQVSEAAAIHHHVNHANVFLVIAVAYMVSTEPLAESPSTRAGAVTRMATSTVTHTVTVTASSIYAEKQAYARLINTYLESVLLITKTMALCTLITVLYIRGDAIAAFIVELCHSRGAVRQNVDSESEPDDID